MRLSLLAHLSRAFHGILLLFRILIFSKRPLTDVQVSIDGQTVGQASRSPDNANLFILPWNTSVYSDESLHRISVIIQVSDTNTQAFLHFIFCSLQDEQNQRLELAHDFSLTNSTINTWGRAKILLSFHWPTVVGDRSLVSHSPLLFIRKALIFLVLSLSGYILVLLFLRHRTQRKSRELRTENPSAQLFSIRPILRRRSIR